MSDFAEQITGAASYPCAVCPSPAIIFTPPDREGRRRWCGEHFETWIAGQFRKATVVEATANERDKQEAR